MTFKIGQRVRMKPGFKGIWMHAGEEGIVIDITGQDSTEVMKIDLGEENLSVHVLASQLEEAEERAKGATS